MRNTMKNNGEFHIRKKRKKEHIDYFLKSNHNRSNLFEDIYIEHNALPELNLEDIDTKCLFLGKYAEYPIMIDAVTGGTEFSREINGDLSKLAQKFSIPMAVGSQTIALENEGSRESFKIVRENMGDEGIVIANLNAHSSLDDVYCAIDMIDADAVQLHLNTAQELVMKEGDKEFRGILGNIKNIVSSLSKPVIVKEVGFGISGNVLSRLYDAGVKYVDISGSGGTNFIEIENERNDEMDFSDIYSWGIPTALSLIQCRKFKDDVHIISSGGIKNSQDVVKSLILGAEMVGITGEILKHLLYSGYEGAYTYIHGIVYKLKMLMLLLGKENLSELKNTPYKIKGVLKDLI